MKTFKRIVAIATALVGVLFLANIASDIQAGFGAVLLALGLLNL